MKVNNIWRTNQWFDTYSFDLLFSFQFRNGGASCCGSCKYGFFSLFWGEQGGGCIQENGIAVLPFRLKPRYVAKFRGNRSKNVAERAMKQKST